MGKVNAIRDARKARTLSQEQMAKLLGVSQQTYCKYERGQIMPERGTQMRIAAILAVRVDELWPEPEAVTK